MWKHITDRAGHTVAGGWCVGSNNGEDHPTFIPKCVSICTRVVVKTGERHAHSSVL